MPNNTIVKVSAFIAMSLDGYIAYKNGDLSWLDDANKCVPHGEDCGFQAYFDSIDLLVLGRNTYEKVRSFGAWPYGTKPVTILSSKPITLPEELQAKVTVANKRPTELLHDWNTKGYKKIYIDGGRTIQSFIREKRLDEITITTIPILLGDGIPLLGKNEEQIKLTLTAHSSYEFGFVQSTYQLKYQQAKG